MPIKCRSGLLNIDATSKNTGKPIFDFGIIPASSQVINYCANSSFEDANQCSKYVNEDKLRQTIVNDCNGKKTCTLENL